MGYLKMSSSNEIKSTRLARLMNLLCCKGPFLVDETTEDDTERVIVETDVEMQFTMEDDSDDAKVTLHEAIVIIDEPKKEQ